MRTSRSRRGAITSVATHLDRDPATHHLMAHAADVLKAGRIFQQIVPPALARVSRVTNLRSGVVIVHTEHGAAANKLKQLTQHLIGEFIKKGFECTGIDIRVQPSSITESETVAHQKPLSEQALTSITNAAQKMRDGSPLKDRLMNLISRVARHT